MFEEIDLEDCVRIASRGKRTIYIEKNIMATLDQLIGTDRRYRVAWNELKEEFHTSPGNVTNSKELEPGPEMSRLPPGHAHPERRSLTLEKDDMSSERIAFLYYFSLDRVFITELKVLKS